jgi:hypothetical protein
LKKTLLAGVIAKGCGNQVFEYGTVIRLTGEKSNLDDQCEQSFAETCATDKVDENFRCETEMKSVEDSFDSNMEELIIVRWVTRTLHFSYYLARGLIIRKAEENTPQPYRQLTNLLSIIKRLTMIMTNYDVSTISR